LGFALLGVSDRPACRGLRRDSSFVLNGSADGGHPSRMHLRVSITERLPRPVAGSGPLLGFSHLSVSRCSNQRQPGLCVHLTGRPPLLVARAGSLGCRDSTGATWRKMSVPGSGCTGSTTSTSLVLPCRTGEAYYTTPAAPELWGHRLIRLPGPDGSTADR
jgi:hypothetical protein